MDFKRTRTLTDQEASLRTSKTEIVRKNVWLKQFCFLFQSAARERRGVWVLSYHMRLQLLQYTEWEISLGVGVVVLLEFLLDDPVLLPLLVIGAHEWHVKPALAGG